MKKEEGVTPGAGADSVESRAVRVRGNLAIYLVVASLGIVKLWHWMFEYPDNASVVVVPNLLLVETADVLKAATFLAGWLGLTGFFASIRDPRVLRHVHLPLRLVKDPEARKMFASVPAVFLAVLMFASAITIGLWNWSVGFSAQYDVTTWLPAGQNAFLADQHSIKGQVSVLEQGEKLVLAGLYPGRPAVVAIRDKYNLRTLELLVIRRKLFGAPEVVAADLHLPSSLAVEEVNGGVQRRTWFTIEIAQALRWSLSKVRVPIQSAAGVTAADGWARFGKTEQGRERVPEWDVADRFYEHLHENRSVVRQWVHQTVSEKGGLRVVPLAFANYQLLTAFEEVVLDLSAFGFDPNWFPVLREASELSVRELN